MMLFEYLRIAVRVLWGHKFRSFLTVLSITIGAFSIVLMSSLAESGLATLRAGIEDLGGARLISVYAKQVERAEGKQASYSGGITSADWSAVFTNLPHVVGRTRFAIVGRHDVSGDTGAESRTDTVAGDAAFIPLMHMRIERGRLFDSDENYHHAKVCVVGHDTGKHLFSDGNAVGHFIDIDGVRCLVVGQLADQERWGINFGFDWKDVVVLPIVTLADVDLAVGGAVDSLVKTDDASSNEVVKRIINALLSDRHHGVDDFEIFDFSKLMDKFDQLFGVMKVIVGFIAGIALLVGGIGVMNMMLVSVSERVREIGIRKALGANPTDILVQFLCEAIVLAGIGGAIGVVSGIGMASVATMIIQHFKPIWVGQIAHGAVVAALSVSVGVGVLFGLFPARRAAALDAITAIRR